jgi:hypothetical protein
MHVASEFIRRATECDHMAQFTDDPVSKTTWKGMADRWRRCAEVERVANAATEEHRRSKRQRQTSPSWSHKQ